MGWGSGSCAFKFEVASTSDRPPERNCSRVHARASIIITCVRESNAKIMMMV